MQAYAIYLFEKNLFLNEPGAVIHLVPKANCVVWRLGLVPGMRRGLRTKWIAEHKLDGSLVFEIDASQIANSR